MKTDARLGTFRLGTAILGSGIKTNTQQDYVNIADGATTHIEIPLEDFIYTLETLNGDTLLLLTDNIILTESPTYESDYLAGVQGIITVILDITNIDWCEIVKEGGHTIAVNGTPARAFVFIKQSGQKFDYGIGITPGDAVMFSCPTDPVIEIGDEIVFNGELFIIADIINHYFANNLIYRKSALQKVRWSDTLPTITGLVASPNETGKTLLTWDVIDPQYPIDHYEIWESTGDDFGEESIISISAPGPGAVIITVGPYVVGRYTTGGRIQIIDSHGNDGYYEVLAYQNNGGVGEVIISTSVALDLTAPLGKVVNLTKYYLRETTKSNSITIKNLDPTTTYYYIVRGIDIHGNAGPWSNEVTATADTTGPPDVEGLR